jgi:alkaline phosphatase D
MRNFTKVVGVWDDHDYGLNNGGASLKTKDMVKEIFFDFIDEPKNSTRRS